MRRPASPPLLGQDAESPDRERSACDCWSCPLGHHYSSSREPHDFCARRDSAPLGCCLPGRCRAKTRRVMATSGPPRGVTDTWMPSGLDVERDALPGRGLDGLDALAPPSITSSADPRTPFRPADRDPPAIVTRAPSGRTARCSLRRPSLNVAPPRPPASPRAGTSTAALLVPRTTDVRHARRLAHRKSLRGRDHDHAPATRCAERLATSAPARRAHRAALISGVEILRCIRRCCSSSRDRLRAVERARSRAPTSLSAARGCGKRMCHARSRPVRVHHRRDGLTNRERPVRYHAATREPTASSGRAECVARGRRRRTRVLARRPRRGVVLRPPRCPAPDSTRGCARLAPARRRVAAPAGARPGATHRL